VFKRTHFSSAGEFPRYNFSNVKYLQS